MADTQLSNDQKALERRMARLFVEADNALVRWRRNWERKYAQPPTEGNGYSKDDLRLWKVAGKLMEIRGVVRRMPG